MHLLAIALVALLGWAAWETHCRARAAGLVQAIRDAEIEQVPDLVKQLATLRRWADHLLVQMTYGNFTSDVRLRGALALLPVAIWMGPAASEPERESHETRHQVAITRPFAIADREVDQDLFD